MIKYYFLLFLLYSIQSNPDVPGNTLEVGKCLEGETFSDSDCFKAKGPSHYCCVVIVTKTDSSSIKECTEITFQTYKQDIETYNEMKQYQYNVTTVSIQCKEGSKSDSNSDSNSDSRSDSKYLQLRILSLLFLIITII